MVQHQFLVLGNSSAPQVPQPLSTPQFSCPSCKDSRGRGCERALSKVASPTTLSQRPSGQISSVYAAKLGFERGGLYMPTITNLLIVCLSGLHTPHLLHLLAGYITNTYPIEIIYSFLMSYLEESYSPNLLFSTMILSTFKNMLSS